VITIIDYGLGNVQAFANIYKRLGVPVKFSREPGELVGATHLILPGVGSFDWAMERLGSSGMREGLDRLVLREGAYVLGVCVGMQMMARGSEEGQSAGLNWFDAEVRRFDESRIQGRTHLPHMGWNDVDPAGTVDLFKDMAEGGRFYFLHSYYFAPNDPADVLATTTYGDRFVSAVRRGNIFGIQCHPEKSHQAGIQVLKNFAGL
jgi:imidazole glycerol-phosphate synthase subunit HisH